MNPLEQRIKYKFRNSLLLAEALTHPSLGHETHRHHFDNQRLEFLGDAVLQLIFTEYLFDRYPEASEGQLTKLRARIVSREGLRIHAESLALGLF
jgi:ribonuclease-3